MEHYIVDFLISILEHCIRWQNPISTSTMGHNKRDYDLYIYNGTLYTAEFVQKEHVNISNGDHI